MKDIGMSWYRHWDGLTDRGGLAVRMDLDEGGWACTQEDWLAEG